MLTAGDVFLLGETLQGVDDRNFCLGEFSEGFIGEGIVNDLPKVHHGTQETVCEPDIHNA